MNQESEFGGKAASLGLILGAGLPAPEGLAASVEHYINAMDTGGGVPDHEVAHDLAQRNCSSDWDALAESS